ncbi:MAG: REP-associated tyrosine transposase [Phycisphaerales bacterium]
MPSAELPKRYDPSSAEPAIRARWEASNAFRAHPERVLSGERPPYAILIPPPNVTARLHLGHALNNSLQDILTRAHRMMGFETLWMPGTDHAGIATQTVVDKRLQGEGQPSLKDYKKQEAEQPGSGRDAFIAKVQAWKDEYEAAITEQLKQMGCSCDWSRQRFTMDEICARAVREAFFRLFRDGLIYRGKRLVNWDPVSQTALADDEVEMREVDGNFYYLRYPLVQGSSTVEAPVPVTWGELATRGYPGADEHPADSEAWITVATTRPETYLGDTAVAINPADPRATALDGYRCLLPLVGRIIPVVRDDYVVMPNPEGDDPKAKFATGFLKVTPAHDPNDWDIGQRHADAIAAQCSAGQVVINVMAPDASISASHGWSDYHPHNGAEVFIGKSREDARQLVVQEFRNRGLLEAVKPYRHSVGHSYRTHVPIEPYLSDQWYCRVTDDRLRGWAQRALPAEQRTSGTHLPNLGGTGVPPVSSSSLPSSSSRSPVTRDLTIHRRHLPHWQKGARTYFITFRTNHLILSDQERQLVLDACFHFHNERAIVRLVTIMPDHVHVLLTPLESSPNEWYSLPELLHSIKSFTAHKIKANRPLSSSVWQEEYFDRMIRDDDEFREKWNYMLHNPVKAGLVRHHTQYPYTRVGDLGEVRSSEERGEVGDGRDARPTEAGKEERTPNSDASMRFSPDRYARTYETWHDNLRDWCISRQLWWGHRIPVWSLALNDPEPFGDPELTWSSLFTMMGLDHAVDGIEGVAMRIHDRSGGRDLDANEISEINHSEAAYEPGRLAVFLCMTNRHYIDYFEERGFTQDPDVLDTWFSSALWPLNTLGWPDPDQSDDTRGLLAAFNPTSVLTTAREIITLWVSRMVMFNRYFLAEGQDTPGPAPFKDVFIHAMIQDGEGRKMSKSLGNGVDPLDIIESHGADAMRFTLCQMTTQTQDVRMPVEPDPTTGKNTSPKFDLGRNFVTKLWNATRFAMMNLEAGVAEQPIDPAKLPLVDRWMLSRLATAIEACETALRDYQFSVYAQTLYDLMWRDFCDWYLEASKPTIKESAAQRTVLRQSLETIIRLLHPICPFVTEAINESLCTVPMGEIHGLGLGHSGALSDDPNLLCIAGWPGFDRALQDPEAEAAFDRVREIVDAIRQARASRKIKDRTPGTLHAPPHIAEALHAAGPVAPALASLAGISTDPPTDPGAAIRFQFGTDELHLSGVVEAVDPEKERGELAATIERLDKEIAILDKRLSNPGYAEKAPPKMVQETRDQREQKRAERQAASDRLNELV